MPGIVTYTISFCHLYQNKLGPWRQINWPVQDFILCSDSPLTALWLRIFWETEWTTLHWPLTSLGREKGGAGCYRPALFACTELYDSSKPKRFAQTSAFQSYQCFGCFHCFYCWQNLTALRTTRTAGLSCQLPPLMAEGIKKIPTGSLLSKRATNGKKMC